MAEERYRELFSSAAEGIFRTTAEGRFEAVNPALANMSGYASPEEMITGIKNIGAQFYANSKDRAKVFSEMLEYGKNSRQGGFFTPQRPVAFSPPPYQAVM